VRCARMMEFFVTCAKATEDLVLAEVQGRGATNARATPGGVSFTGELAVAYDVCLWSRVASRVLLVLARFPAPDAPALYAGTRSIDWQTHLGSDGTLAVDVTSTRSQLQHTRFVAQKVKDAVVDQFRERSGERPSVDTREPDVRLNLHLEHDEATLSIDLSGDSLHRRGYRDERVPAPLKENLAAAVLLRSRFNKDAGATLIDLMCGSGTLLCEAGLIAQNVAPGLGRERWGFSRWRQHESALWRTRREAARAERRDTTEVVFVGYDADERAVRAATLNGERAGVRARIERRELRDAAPPEGLAPGLVVVNPPYGERLGNVADLVPLYAELGRVLKERFGGYSAHVLSAEPTLTDAIGLKAARENALWNGALACRLLHYDIYAERRPPKVKVQRRDFHNRLAKNLKTLGAWAGREGVSCYRLYDADIPEYAVAVDVYERFAHVQEYAPPKSIDPRAARERLDEVMSAVPEVLDVAPADVHLKVRRRQTGGGQYDKQDSVGREVVVREAGHAFLVNFTDYLDTGLFLDHRITRRLIGELAGGKRFLNLFAYTATASVYAAKGGARTTTSVDLSNTYLDWAGRNFAANGLTKSENRLVRADVRQWLDEQTDVYDLVFVDPPTFSTSKAMEGTFDVQRDHVSLVRAVASRLAPRGVLVFSTNFRRFRLDEGAFPEFSVEDITAKTIPSDFARNPRIHKAFLMTRR
jgi:23S rRNA (guanine2445-N2)-methyltransferase / 23S rRNA (guanine2069-N7)-methyltransferase